MCTYFHGVWRGVLQKSLCRECNVDQELDSFQKLECDGHLHRPSPLLQLATTKIIYSFVLTYARSKSDKIRCTCQGKLSSQNATQTNQFPEARSVIITFINLLHSGFKCFCLSVTFTTSFSIWGSVPSI